MADIEQRRRLQLRDLEAACALDMPWAEEMLLAELDRVQSAQKWRSLLGGTCLGAAAYDAIFSRAKIPTPKSFKPIKTPIDDLFEIIDLIFTEED